MMTETLANSNSLLMLGGNSSALCPAISPGEPNKAIALYDGPVDFSQETKTFRADTSISLTWLPSPQIRFQIREIPSTARLTLEDISLSLDDGTFISKGLVTGQRICIIPVPTVLGLSGVVGERVVRPGNMSAMYAQFLVPNFIPPIGRWIAYADGSRRAARLLLRGEGWQITLDEAVDLESNLKLLKDQSGFAITNVGRLEREDGSTFSTEQALEILDALAWYISFSCGRWTGPCLPRGFDRDGQQLWEVWYCSRAVNYRHRFVWMDTNCAQHFQEPFGGFLKLWLDERWANVIRVAIHWYIEANAQAGGIEGAIVLTQTAFELLSSAILVENFGWLSTEGYEKLPAADRIQLLLKWAGIPTAIPPELSDLMGLAKAENWADTPTAMTQIRNTITHPTKKNREKFDKHSGGARVDAWMLGLWCLELCLLRVLDYRGTYGNRLKMRNVGDVEPVPWTVTVHT